MNALKCRTLAKLYECVCILKVQVDWTIGGHSFSHHQISSELVNFFYKTSQITEKTLVMTIDKAQKKSSEDKKVSR